MGQKGLGSPILKNLCNQEKLDLYRPTLSVIVISQNDRERIQEVMDAIVQQQLDQSFEVILVNSGNDGTAAFVRERYPKVHVIHLPEPALPGKARNAGLQVARGNYASFPGSHIVLPPNSLQHRVDAHEKGYVMVTGAVLNGTRSWAGWASYFLDHWIALPGRPSMQLEAAPAHCSYMMGPLKALGGFPEDRRTGEDHERVGARLPGPRAGGRRARHARGGLPHARRVVAERHLVPALRRTAEPPAIPGDPPEDGAALGPRGTGIRPLRIPT